jgi:hypothetical protein
MTSLMDLTKYVVARIYPVLVWGALMGFVAHAGLRSQFSQISTESESASIVETNSASNVPTHPISDRMASVESVPDRVAMP